MAPLPGWLLRAAREGEYRRVFELLAPKTPSSPAIYVLEKRDGFQIHAVDDAESGIDGATIALSRFEIRNMGLDLIGFLSGRLGGTEFGSIAIEMAALDVPDPLEVERMEAEGGVPC